MKNKQPHFYNVKAANGRIVLQSEMYTTLAACINGAAAVSCNGKKQANYRIKKAINGQPYFILKAANNKIIGVSETYSSLGACKKGILAAIRNAGQIHLYQDAD